MRVDLIIRRGPEIGYEAEVSVYQSGGDVPVRQVHVYLPTKADCHSLAQHIARQYGAADFASQDRSGT